MKRLLTFLLCISLLSTQLTTYALAVDDSSSTSTSQTDSTNEDSNKDKDDNDTTDDNESNDADDSQETVNPQPIQKELSLDSLTTIITPDIQKISSELSDSLSKTSKSITLIIQNYAKLLSIADWLANNGYTYSSTSKEMECFIIDDSDMKDLHNSLVNYQNQILSIVTDDSKYDVTGKHIDIKCAFTEPEDITLQEIAQASEVKNTDKYSKLLQNIIKYYYEDKVNILGASALSVDATKVTDHLTLQSELTSAMGSYNGGQESAINAILVSAGGDLKALSNSWLEIKKCYDTLYTYRIAQNQTKIPASNPDTTDESSALPIYPVHKEVVSSEVTKLAEPAASIIAALTEDTTSDPNKSDSNTGSTMDKIDASNDILSLISNAKLVNNEIVIDGSEGQLTAIGFAIVSASSVYDPFISTAGNDLYMATIKKFLSSQEDAVTSIVETAVNTKKPLYVAESASGSWATSSTYEAISMGDYRFAYLSDILNFDSSSVNIFSLIKGSMQTSEVDSNVMEYVRGSNESPVQETTGGTTAEEEDTTDTNSTDDTTNTTQTSPSTETTDKVDTNVSGVSVSRITIGNESIAASDRQMSMPILYFTGSKAKSSAEVGLPYYVGSTTAALLRNTTLDVKNNSKLEQAEKELLFVNGLGDVVLADNTVIIPAIANPAYYNYDELDIKIKNSENKFSTNGTEWVQESENGYYPFTSAWMNHYPAIRIYNESRIASSNKNDAGKWALASASKTNESSNLGFVEIDKATDKGTTFKGGSTGHAAPIAINQFSVTEDTSVMYSGYRLFELGQGTEGIWGTITSAVSSYIGGNYENVYFIQQTLMSSDGLSLFPLVYDSSDLAESYEKMAGAITTSALRYISDKDDTSESYTSSGTFRVDFFVKDVIAEARRGTQYGATLVKNAKVSYDEIVNDTYNRIEKFFISIAESALNTLGKTEGVLAIRNVYENPYFNAIVRFLTNYYLIIAVALVVLVAVRFLAGHFNVIYMLFICMIVAAGFEVYTQWLPTLLPSAYNFFVNDIVEDITWSTVFNNAERYEELTSTAGRKSFDGADKPYTSTITLYTLTNAEIKTVAERIGVTEELIKSGEIIDLDSTGGVFLHGNQIKMSVDALLLNNSLRGLYHSQWELLEQKGDADSEDLMEVLDTELNKNPYSIGFTSHYMGLETYYTPYQHIQTTFLTSLNNFTNIFSMQRNTYSYGRSIYKDAFVVNNFTNSGIFLAPGNDDILRMNINDTTITGTAYDVDRVMSYVHQLFDPQEDWLGLRRIFLEPDDAFKESLWGAMLVRQEFYNPDFTYTDEQAVKITKLINYINNQTKLWIMNHQDEINFISDDNAIKMISLYATTCFNQKVAMPSMWLYPVYVNSQDITLEDVLYGSMTTTLDRNIALDGTVVNTVAVNNGIFGVVFFLLILILSSVFIFFITYLVPTLYCLFGILIVIKLLKTENGGTLVRGYLKITLATLVLYTIFNLSFSFIKIGGYSWYGFLGTTIIMMACIYMLFFVCLAVVQDFSNLGDATFKSNLLRATNLVTRGITGRLNGIKANIFNHGHNRYVYTESYSNYRRSSDSDDYGTYRTYRQPTYGEVSRAQHQARYSRNHNSYDSYRRDSDSELNNVSFEVNDFESHR